MSELDAAIGLLTMCLRGRERVYSEVVSMHLLGTKSLGTCGYMGVELFSTTT